MDFDSSSKFISSLAKFLQSLCNGYVEFNSGVEVIGHIYLNVDTGKKIDYVLNEKVCKTDENSVTFISNSFHAQPLEKPKPAMKNASTSCHTQQSENMFREQREAQRTEEPTRDSHRATPLKDHSPRWRPSLSSTPRFTQKRPLSHHKSADHRHSVKHMKIDLSMGPDGTLQDRGVVDCVTTAAASIAFTHSASSPSLTTLESTGAQFQKPFSPSAEEAINSQNLAESADVKPELDIDMNIVHVKQEYDAGEGAEDKESCDESQDSKHIYPNVPPDYYYNSNDVKGHMSSEFSNEMLAEYYQSGAGPSARGLPGDPSGLRTTPVTPYTLLWTIGMGCPVLGCGAKKILTSARMREHWKEKHEKIVPKYQCSVCEYASKRRSNLIMHFRKKHVEMDLSQCVGDVHYQDNKEFENPGDLTLQLVLSGSKDPVYPDSTLDNSVVEFVD